MTEQTTTNLEVLENRAERALEKAETGWREFADAMREIRDNGMYPERYGSFRLYYDAEWAERVGRSYSTVNSLMHSSRVVAEMEGVVSQADNFVAPTNYTAAGAMGTIQNPEERAAFWTDKVLPDHPQGHIAHQAMRDKLREYKGEGGAGVIEQAEARGIVVPDEPKGKTPSETAWLALTTASRAIKGVEPADAARVESGKVAGRYVEQMAELAEWMHLFVHELNLYAEQTASGARR